MNTCEAHRESEDPHAEKQQRYVLNGYGEVVGYIEHDYDLKISAQPGNKEIKFRSRARCRRGMPDDRSAGRQQGQDGRRRVPAYHFGGMLDPKKDAAGDVSARFNAKGRITMSATFSGDADSAVVKMTFTNFDGLGTVAKTATGAQLNDELFDDIGRFPTREPNTLLSEALPTRIVSTAHEGQQDQIKRRWENKINEQQQDELAQIKREQSITGRLAKLVTKEDAPAPADAGGSTSWFGKLKGLVKK
jgi:hypothetical protein